MMSKSEIREQDKRRGDENKGSVVRASVNEMRVFLG